MQGNALSNSLTVLLAVCALVVTGVVLRRELSTTPSRPLTAATLSTATVSKWPEILRGGHRIGPSTAPVTIVVFSDFECPACAYFATGPLPAVRRQFGDSVSIVVRHLPIPYHRFAYPAARASECAADQGHFEQFYKTAFSKQDSLGLKSFWSYAKESGVEDSAGFESCNQATSGLSRVDSDAALGHEIGATATPTVLVDGRIFSEVPDSAALATAVRRRLEHRRASQ